MDIKVTIQPDQSWCAIDADTYEAESDSEGYWSRCAVGYGPTREAAIGDLLDQIIEKLKDENDADRHHLADLSDLQKRPQDPGAANAASRLQEVPIADERSADKAPDREPLGMAITYIIRALNDIVTMAITPATYDEIAAEEEALWVIKGRAEWLLSYIKEKQKDQPRIRAVK